MINNDMQEEFVSLLRTTSPEILNGKPGERPSKLSDGGASKAKRWRLACGFAGAQENLAVGV